MALDAEWLDSSEAGNRAGLTVQSLWTRDPPTHSGRSRCRGSRPDLVERTPRLPFFRRVCPTNIIAKEVRFLFADVWEGGEEDGGGFGSLERLVLDIFPHAAVLEFKELLNFIFRRACIPSSLPSGLSKLIRQASAPQTQQYSIGLNVAVCGKVTPERRDCSVGTAARFPRGVPALT